MVRDTRTCEGNVRGRLARQATRDFSATLSRAGGVRGTYMSAIEASLAADQGAEVRATIFLRPRTSAASDLARFCTLCYSFRANAAGTNRGFLVSRVGA